MIGRILGAAVGTAVRVVNLPAQAIDRVGDWMLNEENLKNPGGPRVSAAGNKIADELERLLETLDE